MIHVTRRAALAAFSCLATSPAGAACLPEHAAALLASGLDQAQVDRACAALASGTATAAGGVPGDGRFDGGDVIDPEIGDDGTWKKYLHAGSYVLQNKRDVGSGFILLSGKAADGWQSFGARVRFSHEKVEQGLVGPALVHETGGPGGEVVIYTLQQDGTVAATRGVGGAFEEIASRTDPGFAVADWTYAELAVRKRGAATEFLVGGKPTGLTAPHPGREGGFGIAVFGIGSFEFRDFAREPPG